MAAKRSRGEGTIRRRKDGRYEGRSSVGGRRVSVYGETRREVADKLAALRHEPPPQEPSLTCGAWFDRWLEGKADRAESTHWRLVQVVRRHLRRRFGEARLSVVNAAMVDAWQRDLAVEGVSPRERARALAALRDALGEADRLGLVRGNAAKAVPMPRVPPPTTRALTGEEYTALRDAFPARERPWVALAVDSGCRPGELFGLDWSDVDFVVGSITVRRSYSQGRTRAALKPPKTRAGRRTICLAAETLDVLRGHREAMQREGRDVVAGAVFVSRVGNRRDRANFTCRIFVPAVRAARLEGVTLHTLRHTCATWLLSAGVPVRVVADRLGHSSVSVVLETYAHLLPGQQSIAGVEMGKLLSNIRGGQSGVKSDSSREES